MIYDRIYAQANGGVLGENLEIDTELSADIAIVKTIAKGFAGITPGTLIRTVKFKSAISILGAEFNFERYMALSIPFQLSLTLGASGQRVIMAETYVIGPVSMTTGLGKTTEQDVTVVGKGAPFA